MSATRKIPAIGEPGWRPTEVHPLAAAFRMMTDEELAELAADIKANGLLHNIAIDDSGRLVDGRNRLRACDIAGVEPSFQQLNGIDVAAFVESTNLHRRNLTVGQRAIGKAFLAPEPEKGGRGKKGLGDRSVSYERLSLARAVLKYSVSLAERVRDGNITLDAAFKEVEQAREASQSSESKLAELRHWAPDLADLVSEERLPLDEAFAALVKRKEDAAALEANQRETILRLTESAWSYVTAWANPEFLAGAHDRLQDKAFREEWLRRLRFDPDRFPDIGRGAQAFAELIQSITGGKS